MDKTISLSKNLTVSSKATSDDKDASSKYSEYPITNRFVGGIQYNVFASQPGISASILVKGGFLF
jgi:hypothetical protein